MPACRVRLYSGCISWPISLGATVFRGDTLIKDVIAARPEAGAVLQRLGLSCGSCLAAAMETLSDAANVHDVPVDQLLAELNGLDSTTTPGREPLDG